jgi:plastocyanin
MQIVWAIVIVIVLAGLYWWWQSAQAPVLSDDGTPVSADVVDDSGTQQGITATTSTSNSATNGTTHGSGSVPMKATVMFNGSGFSPASVTVAQGGTVTWTSTNGDLWIASDPHPIHNGYDGTTMQQHCSPGYTGATPFDQCTGATSYSFTFNKVGTWGYHDHLDSGIRGSVTVVAAQ